MLLLEFPEQVPRKDVIKTLGLGLGLLDLHLFLRDHLDLLDRLDLLEHLGLLVHREAGRRLGIRGPRRSTQRGARAHVKC